MITQTGRTVDDMCQDVVSTEPEGRLSAEEGLGSARHGRQIQSIVDMAAVHNIDCGNESNKFRL